jgi:PAS domain S-box-containing protein
LSCTPAKAEITAEGEEKVKKKILVVDNHRLVLRFMENLLNGLGHEVLTAKDGLSALEVLETYIPDVIFVDLVMPNIDGEKLCRIIRSTPELNGVHLVVLSAIAAEREINFTGFGANACIAKGPFKELARHVSDLLSRFDEQQTDPAILGLELVDQREITKELLSSGKHFEVIINNMAEGVLEITPAGKIIFVNPSALALLDIEEEKLLGTSLPALFTEFHRFRIRDLLQKTNHGPQIASENTPLILNSRQLALHLLPLHDDDSFTIIVIMRDITEWKENEKELENYRQHLEDLVRQRNAELLESNRKLREEMLNREKMEKHLHRIQKMEALGTFAGGLAHDFKNILQVILGHADVIRKSKPDSPRMSRSLEKISEAGERATHLLQQILTFSSRTEQEKRAVHLPQIIDDTLSLLAGVDADPVDIRREISACPPVMADASQMKQVLFNLFTNARQAMRNRGGTLTITLEEIRLDSGGGNKETGLPPGRYAKLTVKDTGPGMSKEILERIFEPYFTTKQPGEGTGLGLAAVHGIVRSHDGAILARSTPGLGSTFLIYLPIISPVG